MKMKMHYSEMHINRLLTLKTNDMKRLLLLPVFLFVLSGFAPLQAQNFDENEIKTLLDFLLRESAEEGKLNYEQIDPKNKPNTESTGWVRKFMTTQIIDFGDRTEHRASKISWPGKKLAGDLSLKGFEYLEELQCGSNELSSLDVSGLTNLKILDCEANEISSLDVSSLTSLEVLQCSFNKLSILNLSGLTNLKRASFYGNEITELNVSGCTNVTSLSGANNKMSSLDVSGFKEMVFLDCGNNELSGLNLSGCTSLVVLDCSTNKLTSLDLTDCANIRDLECSENELTELDLTGYTKLEYIGCFDNKLSSLVLKDCPKLETVECGDNELSSLNLSGCESLVKLNCYNSNLSDLNVTDCTNLEYLDCYNNKLSSLDVPAGLNELYCQKNQLSFSTLLDLIGTIPTFRYAPQIPVLSVTAGDEIDMKLLGLYTNEDETWFKTDVLAEAALPEIWTVPEEWDGTYTLVIWRKGDLLDFQEAGKELTLTLEVTTPEPPVTPPTPPTPPLPPITDPDTDPDPDPNSNAEVENITRIWSEGGYVYVQMEVPGNVRIITMSGLQVVNQKLSAGENRIPLGNGIYIVVLSDGMTHKIVVRNI